MATTIKLPDELISEARRYGSIFSRSVPKQIEYWSRIGRIAEENPDLSYNAIKDILLGLQEVEEGEISIFSPLEKGGDQEGG